MKLAVVPLPNERGCEFVIKDGEIPPPIYIVNRGMQITVLSGLLLAALALCGMAYFAATETTPVAALAEPVPAPAARPSRPMVQVFDGAHDLKRGDLVMLQGGGTEIRQIAAAPRQAVLIRRDNVVHGLYMGGRQKYVVISGADTRIVSADEIHAVVPPALTAAAR
jgi:hypothetical protein